MNTLLLILCIANFGLSILLLIRSINHDKRITVLKKDVKITACEIFDIMRLLKNEVNDDGPRA